MNIPGQVPAEISIREKLAYGCGDLSSNLLWGLTSSYLMYYYTDIYRLSPAAAGWILLLARVFDAFCDPAIGWFVDRRGGMVIPRLIRNFAVPFGVCGALCFLPLPLSPMGKVLWAGFSYILFGAIYSCINTPYGALATMIARSSADRVSLNAFRLMGCQAGQFLVASLTIPLLTLLGGGHSLAQRQFGMALFVALLGMFGSFLWWFVVRGCVVRYPSPPAHHDFKGILAALGRNRPWWVSNALTFFQFVGIATLFGFAFYFVRARLHGDERLGAAVMTLATIIAFLGAFVCPMVTRRIGILQTALVATGLQILAFVGLMLPMSQQLTPFFALIVMVAFGQGLTSPLFYVLLARTIDASLERDAIGTAGMAYSINTLVAKLSMGVTGFVLAHFLDLGHYDAASPVISATTAAWILAGFVLVPIASNIMQFGLLLVWGRASRSSAIALDG